MQPLTLDPAVFSHGRSSATTTRSSIHSRYLADGMTLRLTDDDCALVAPTGTRILVTEAEAEAVIRDFGRQFEDRIDDQRTRPFVPTPTPTSAPTPTPATPREPTSDPRPVFDPATVGNAGQPRRPVLTVPPGWATSAELLERRGLDTAKTATRMLSTRLLRAGVEKRTTKNRKATPIAIWPIAEAEALLGEWETLGLFAVPGVPTRTLREAMQDKKQARTAARATSSPATNAVAPDPATETPGAEDAVTGDVEAEETTEARPGIFAAATAAMKQLSAAIGALAPLPDGDDEEQPTLTVPPPDAVPAPDAASWLDALTPSDLNAPSGDGAEARAARTVPGVLVIDGIEVVSSVRFCCRTDDRVDPLAVLVAWTPHGYVVAPERGHLADELTTVEARELAAILTGAAMYAEAANAGLIAPIATLATA